MNELIHSVDHYSVMFSGGKVYLQLAMCVMNGTIFTITTCLLMGVINLGMRPYCPAIASFPGLSSILVFMVF